MSTEMRLARLGLLHLLDDTQALQSALKEKATLLRCNPKLRPPDIAFTSITNNNIAKPPNKLIQSD
jgi:hypothetical protein